MLYFPFKRNDRCLVITDQYKFPNYYQKRKSKQVIVTSAIIS